MFGGGNKGWQAFCTLNTDGTCNCLLHSKRPKVEESLDELSFQRSICNAAQQGNLEKVQKILDKKPAAVNSDGAQETSGYSPLHYAARAGHAEIVQLLITAGANVNASTKSGRSTPLMRAAHMGHVLVIKQLLSAGADGMLQDADGESALHKAAAQGHIVAYRLLADSQPSSLELRDKYGRLASERLPTKGP